MSELLARIVSHRFSHLLLFFIGVSFAVPGARAGEKKYVPPFQATKIAGDPQSTLMNINNLTMWANANGMMERRLSDLSAGVTFPKDTSAVVYAGGLLWGGIVRDGRLPR